MKVRRWLGSLLIIVFCFAAVSCGKSGSDNKGSSTENSKSTDSAATMIIPINSDSVTFMNPYDTLGSDDQLIALSPCFDPLFITTKEGTRWYLADSLEKTSDDGTQYQLKLKENLKWHDGKPITSDDVIFTIQALQEPSNSGSLQYVQFSGYNLEAEKVDDTTVHLTLKKPFSAFESKFGRMQIFPKHVFNGNIHILENKEAMNAGIGSGPFKLLEFKPGESITYERNDDYYRGKPDLERLIIRTMPDESTQEAALQTGEISLMRIGSPEKLEAYKNNPEYTIYNLPEGRLNYMTFNYQSPKMKDIKARKAIALALNNEDILKGAYGSKEFAVPAKNFLSPENLYYNNEMKGYQQNLEEAKKLAEESGLTKEPLNYIYNQNRPNMKETAQIVQQQLKQIGVEVNIQGLDSPAFFPKLFAAWLTGETVVDTSWDLATNGMDQLNADPATIMDEYVGKNAEKGYYSSDKTRELWTKAVEEIDETKREQYFRDLQVSMLEDYSMYPMANTNYVLVARSEFKGLDDIKRVPIFEDYLKIRVEK